MISLLWRILGDNTPIKKVFKDTEKAAHASGTAAGEMFGQQIKSQILRYVGAGAIMSQINRLVADAVKLQGESRATGTGVEELQVMQRVLEETGLTMEELKRNMPEIAEPLTKLLTQLELSGGILDAETVEEFANASRALKEFGNSVIPVVARFITGSVDGLGRIVNLVKGYGAGVAADIFDMRADSATGGEQQLLRQRQAVATGDMYEAYEKAFGEGRLTVGQTEVGSAASAVSAGVLRARENRARQAAAWARAMTDNATTVGAASRGVPFMSGIAEDMLKEMKKSTEELQRLSNIVNQKL